VVKNSEETVKNSEETVKNIEETVKNCEEAPTLLNLAPGWNLLIESNQI
jgi:hypothetical protein